MIDLKSKDLYHMDIKPCNILLSERLVKFEELKQIVIYINYIVQA